MFYKFSVVGTAGLKKCYRRKMGRWVKKKCKFELLYDSANSIEMFSPNMKLLSVRNDTLIRIWGGGREGFHRGLINHLEFLTSCFIMSVRQGLVSYTKSK